MLDNKKKNDVNLSLIEKLMVGLYIFASLFIRPTILGEEYTKFALVTIVLITILYIYFKQKLLGKILILKTFLSLYLYYIYILFQSLVIQATMMNLVLKETLSTLIIILTYTIFLFDDKMNYYFFKYYYKLIKFFCLSSVITFFLSGFINIEFLKIYKINIETYPGSGYIFFPFTVMYNNNYQSKLLFFNLFRSQGFLRESGIFQAFIIWAIINSEVYSKRKIVDNIMLILGLFLTGSTAGFFVLATCLLFKLFKSNLNWYKKAIFLVVIVINIYLGINVEHFGLKYKLIYANESFLDRYLNTTYSIKMLLEHPLIGTGFNYSSDKNSSINFIALFDEIGIIGIVLIVQLYYKSIFDKKKYTNKKILSILPFIITALFFQPIIVSPLIVIFLMQKV